MTKPLSERDEPAPVTVDSGPMKRCLDSQTKLLLDFNENILILDESVAEIAEQLQRAKSVDKVGDCKEILAEMIRLEAQVAAQREAVKACVDTYSCNADSSTDFQARIEQLRPNVNCVPEQDERYLELEEKLWRVDHPNEPMPGTAADANLDDDLVMEDSRRDVSCNARCPISGTEVMELKEPVVDAKGFVYEKAAIEDWLKGRPGQGTRPVPCPVAATSHSISLSELKRATKVIREQKRRQNRPQRNAQDDDQILDV